MTNRLSEAAQHLRNRLRDVGGLTATISQNGVVIAENIIIVQISLQRLVRTESEFLIENDDAAFLIGVDVFPEDPTAGMQIVVGNTEYRVTEKPELETTWRWHDRERIQRAVFAKEWGVIE